MHQEPSVPILAIDANPDAAWLQANLESLLAALPAAFLARQRWFASKSDSIRLLSLVDGAVLGEGPAAVLALVDVRLAAGPAATYSLPLAVRPEEDARRLGLPASGFLLFLAAPNGRHLLYDAAGDPDCARALLALVAGEAVLPGRRGRFSFAASGGEVLALHLPVRPLEAEQSNTSLVYGDRYVLKLYRRLQNGPNPDVELPLFLTTRAHFPYSPPLLGYAEYRRADFSATFVSLQGFVANEGDGWRYALEQLANLSTAARAAPAVPDESFVRRAAAASLQELRRLGETTARLHLALSSRADDPAFAPEPVAPGDVASWQGALGRRLERTLAAARAAAGRPPAPAADRLCRLVGRGAALRRVSDGLSWPAVAGLFKIRHHGDYHLGQVLRTPGGFVVVDFEGEPARPLTERRARHLALRDVAGLLRSLDYAAGAVTRVAASDEGERTRRVAALWADLAGREFLAGYRQTLAFSPLPLLPADPALAEGVLAALLLDKALYELTYELDNRPDWLGLPLGYLSQLAALA